MYQSSVPALIRMLGNLKAILEKGVQHADAHKFDAAVLLQTRLYPDMFPLVRQVQIATDVAKGCAARLAGVEPPRYEDNETTFPELLARVDKTIEYLKSFPPQKIDGSEQRAITLQMRSGSRSFTGAAYLHEFVLPNVYFHITTAYNILRHSGVVIGKQDFLGRG